MDDKGKEVMNCGGMKVVKHSTLAWYSHLERMGNDETTRKIYKSRVDSIVQEDGPHKM